jgi:hypothetical protein
MVESRRFLWAEERLNPALTLSKSYLKVTKEMPVVVYKSGQTMDSYTYQAIRGLIKLGGKKMARTPITTDDKFDFVIAILESDVFTAKDEKAIRILQQIIDDAKYKVARKTVQTMDREARKQGKFISNMTEATKVASKFKALDENSITAAIAREMGLDF